MATWLERLTQPSPTNAPPSRGELRRNDWLVAGLVLFSLFLALGIRNQVVNATRHATLGENLPRLAYPERWRERTVDGAVFSAFNPGSPSTFDTAVTVTARPLRSDESLEDARADRGIKQITTLPAFRELDAQRMTVYNNQPALVSTYSYVADPTQATGATGLPVVVEGQEIMFIDNGQFMVVTLEADASQWDEEQGAFDLITNSLKLKAVPDENTPQLTPTPAAAESTGQDSAAPAPAQTDNQGDSFSGNGSFSGAGQSNTQAGAAEATATPQQ